MSVRDSTAFPCDLHTVCIVIVTVILSVNIYWMNQMQLETPCSLHVKHCDVMKIL